MRLDNPCRPLRGRWIDPIPRGARARLLVGLLTVLAACSGPGPRTAPSAGARAEASRPQAPVPGRGGAYYADDGPGEGPAPDPATVAQPIPRPEPLNTRANRPYVVFGKTYMPMTELAPWRERGMASWYGRKFHGQKTSSGEPYDMYGMTAAHPTLPIPSYARVTNLSNGRTVIVRINDRGPFLRDRVADLSYTAAAKLGYVETGSAQVELELVTRFDGDAEPALASGSAAVPASTQSAPSVRESARGPAPVSTAEQSADTPSEDLRLVVQTTWAGAAGQAEAPITVGQPQSARTPMAAPTAREGATGAAPDAGGYWLQLAAFSSRENADSARARLANQIGPLSSRIEVLQEGAMFKLLAGPYSGREQASAAAQRIEQATQSRPFARTR
jgi:rare lipoprotein A